MSHGGGTDFSDLATQAADPVNADASYSYKYMIQPADKGKLYFRLKLVDAYGTVAYSPLRIIDLGEEKPQHFSIYPNPPTDFIQLTFPVTGTAWQVDILSADGSRVQRNYYPNANQAHVNFARKLPPGTYFARATDSRTAQSYVGSFVIQ